MDRRRRSATTGLPNSGGKTDSDGSISRRRILELGALAATGVITGPVWGRRRGDAQLITQPTRQAVRKGLNFLAKKQHSEGHFGPKGYQNNVAICGLAGLAFMSNGSTPGRGRYGQNVRRCVSYVLSCVGDSGFIRGKEKQHGPMYGHGFSTLLLAEAYGTSPDPQIREALTKAVKLIVDTQSREGGWRYEPNRREADISVTVCQVMALRAARNAGIHVPNKTVNACINYVKRSQNEDGGFMYMLSQPAESAFPRSAAGVVALYSAGIYEGEEITKGLKYLSKFVPKPEAPRGNYFFYSHYYAVQAMWHSGGKPWQQWYTAIRDVLLAQQKNDGSWEDVICAEYGTAMASLVLQMPNNYLPIFQP